MDTRHLEAFVAVLDVGSFTRAASHLRLSQPTITARIKSLEHVLGTTLVERLPAGVRPTAAGVELLPYAREIIALSARAGAAVSANGEPHGRIDVGTVEALTTYRLLPVIEFLYLRYPEVQISMHTPSTDEAAEQVRDGRLDCAFLVDTVVERPDLHTKVLCREPVVLVAGPDQDLAERASVDVDELRAVTMIRADNHAGYHARFDTTLGIPRSADRPRLFELNSIDAVKRSVANGIGLALMPMIAVQTELERGLLRRVRWSPPFETFTQVVWRRDSAHPGFHALLAAAEEVVEEQTRRIRPTLP